MRLNTEEVQKYKNTAIKKQHDYIFAGYEMLNLIDTIEALQQENEQLRAQVAAMKTAICNMCRGKECDNCAFGDANITETIKHWRPERVCLCGSTRFFRAFDDWNFRFTLEGKIVLTIGCNTKSDKGLGLTDEDKIKLDELHKRKIDLADWIFVIDVGGYIGSSTQSEIEYAQLHGKPIKYLSKEFPDYQEPADYHNPADVAEIEDLRKIANTAKDMYDEQQSKLANMKNNLDMVTMALCKRDEALRKAREAIKAAWSDGSANAAMDKASEALAAIDKAIGGKEDV